METVSVVVSAWNEEANIKRCLSSVRWADEIILVDNSSSDATTTLARQFTQKIFRRPNNPMLNVNKNFGFGKATRDWVLSLDADEVVTPEVAREIKEKVLGFRYSVHGSRPIGYWMPRQNIIFGKWIQHGLWWPDRQLRLFRKGRGRFPCLHVHEYLEVDGLTGNLTMPYIHYNYESISQFIRKMETIYTESEVQKLVSSNYQPSWYDAIRFPVSDFVKIYFAQEGYKDGLHGLVLSLLQSFYSLVVFAKLWERHRFAQQEIPLAAVTHELHRSGREIRYWMLDAKLKNAKSLLEKIWYKIRRHYVSTV